MESAVHIEFQDLVSATEAAQLLVSDIVPNAAAAVGVAAMMLTNFLASGILCGLFEEEFVDKMMVTIRENIKDSVKTFKIELSAEAATPPIQYLMNE